MTYAAPNFIFSRPLFDRRRAGNAVYWMQYIERKCIIMDKQAAKRIFPRPGEQAWQEAASGLVWGLIAFLLGQARLPFDTYPLGIALLSAARTRVGWMLCGLCASAFAAQAGISPWVRLAAAVFVAAVRILVRLTIDPPAREESLPFSARLRGLATPGGRAALFGESLMLRMATACAAAFLMSVWAITAGEYRYDDLFGGFLAMTAAPLFCLGTAPFFDPAERQAGGLRWEAAAGLILTAICYAMREADFFGVSPTVFLTFVLTLLITRRMGIGRGAAIGAACGLCVGPLYAPLFCIAAGVSGLLWRKSSTAAVTLSALLGMVWGGYVEGLTALIKLVPALVCGAIFVLSAERLDLLPDVDRAPKHLLRHREEKDSLTAAVAAQRAESAEARLAALSETFSALSRVCCNLSDRLRRPGIMELRRVCDETCDRYCRTCPHRDLCWEREYGSTADILGKLTLELHGAGKATAETVPDYLRRRCPSMAAILDDINDSCARLWAEAARGDRTEVFAVDYEAVSAILAETLAAEQADYAVDEALTDRVRALAAKLDLGARGILAYGGRRKQIIAEGLDLRRSGMGVDDLRTAFADCCGFALTTPVFEIRDDLVSMRLCTARRFAVESVRSTASADAAEACGDSILTFESGGNDCFYALISDGMGSGREAALTARICTMFLEKMLASGNRRETALRLLNAFVRAKGIECSATIDLMELDLISGRASFIKSGAAPSYVRRDGNLFKLQSKTVPIGIMRALDAEQLCFDIAPGDIIIMLSDGIAQSFEESVWLLDLLSCGWDEADDLTTVAEKILAGAAANNARPDDRSVALIRVTERTAG